MRCAHDMHVTLTLTHDASRAPLGEAKRLGSLGSLRSSSRLELPRLRYLLELPRGGSPLGFELKVLMHDHAHAHDPS